MEYKLEPLKVSHLANFSVAQLITEFLALPALADKSLASDESLSNGLAQLANHLSNFNKAIPYQRANEYTSALASANAARVKAYRALVRAVKLGAMSDVPEQQQAANHLFHLLKTTKGVDKLSNLSRSAGLSFLARRFADEYAPYVKTLGIKRYADAVRTTNEAFLAVQSQRDEQKQQLPRYDARALRLEMLECYARTLLYVQVMASVGRGDAWVQLMQHINVSRKHYAWQLARHKSAAKEAGETAD
jgi:hypothetical protein